MTSKINPLDASDTELEDMYRSLWTSSKGNNYINVEANLLATEMTRRLAEATDKSSKRARNIGLAVSFLALFVAGISAVFSYADWKGDFVWQDSQLSELKQLSEEVKQNRIANELALGKLEASVARVESGMKESVMDAASKIRLSQDSKHK